MRFTMQQLEDGALRVCSAEPGFEDVCNIVSSMHLTPDAQHRVERRIQQMAADAFKPQ